MSFSTNKAGEEFSHAAREKDTKLEQLGSFMWKHSCILRETEGGREKKKKLERPNISRNQVERNYFRHVPELIEVGSIL